MRPPFQALYADDRVLIQCQPDLLAVPGLTEVEQADQARMWLGWGDWNVIACVPPEREDEAARVAREMGATVVRIGTVTSQHSGVVLSRGSNSILAPRLESERFARDSWMLKGIGEYVQMLRSVRLP